MKLKDQHDFVQAYGDTYCLVAHPDLEPNQVYYASNSDEERCCRMTPISSIGTRGQAVTVRIAQVNWNVYQPRARAVTVQKRGHEPVVHHYFRRPIRNWKRGLTFKDHAIQRYEGEELMSMRMDGTTERRVAHRLLSEQTPQINLEEAFDMMGDWDWAAVALNGELVVSRYQNGDVSLFWQALRIGSVIQDTHEIKLQQEYSALEKKLRDYTEEIDVY